MKIWNWLRKQWREDWPFYVIVGTGPMIIVTSVLAALILNYCIQPAPTTAYTTHADCTMAMGQCERDMRVLIDKIEAQGQLMEAYRHRLSLYDDLLPRRSATP